MRVLLVTADPSAAMGAAGREAPSPGPVPDDVGRALVELGCAVTAVDFDLGLDGEKLMKAPPQAIVLDARDRAPTAYACLKRLRQNPRLALVPSLVCVTVRALETLDYGAADDFMLVPVVPNELYARLRQLDWKLAAFSGEERLKVGELVIDTAGYEVHVRDRRLTLTHQEFELLKFLAQHRGRVFTREQLLAQVWGYSYFGGTRTVDIHVRRLRAKLGKGMEHLIETVRHVGYKMRPQ